MENKTPERVLPLDLNLVFRRGLGRRLLLCFLGFALVPMALVGFISYKAAYQRLEQEVRQNIRIAAELKSRQLRQFFDDRLADADSQGRERTTISFFNTLVRRHEAAEGTVSEFVRSVPWAMAVSAYGSDMELHASLHGYSDILMIDKTGNILFSSAKQKDLADNLNQGRLAHTPFADAFRRTLKTGTPGFAGLDPDSPAGETEIAFVTAAIRSEDSRPGGVIAFKIPLHATHQVLEAPMAIGIGSRVYLVGADLRLLAGTIGAQHFDNGAMIDTAQIRTWRENLADGKSESSIPAPSTYTGPDGNQVMGTYAEIRLGDTPYALIVEIETTAAFAAINPVRAVIVTIAILTAVGALVTSAALARRIVNPVRDLSRNTLMVAEGRFDRILHVTADNEIGELASSVGSMIQHLKADKDTQSRFISGLADLHRLIGGRQEHGDLYLTTLEFLSGFLDLCQADFFIMDGGGELTCTSRFPIPSNGELPQVVSPVDRRLGQAVLEKTTAVFQKEPASGVVTPVPTPDRANLIAVPLMVRQTVNGVLALEKSGLFSRFDYQFVEAASAVLAMAVNPAWTRQQEADLRPTAREAVPEESTRERQAQSRNFQAPEEKLQLKQLELEAANAQMVKNAADLEAHMAILETQQLDMQRQNTALEKAHRELAKKAGQLEVTSRYKTEFMANMSHELRTPLNSILLLSRLLLENKEKTLTGRQSEFAQTIHSAGEDLLNLINEVLDLAKVESGKNELELHVVSIQSIVDAMQVSFAPLAEQQGITFTCQVSPEVPDRLISNRKRLEQIVKNFLSNAFKFTARGSIRMAVAVSRELVFCRGTGDGDDNGCLEISVVDTGIGIPAAKHQIVFEAFQQVDGSTRRKYGGTGLGLSISRELARLLGGEITMDSDEGRGSRFSLHLPIIPLPEKQSAAIRTHPGSITSDQPTEAPSSAGDSDASQGKDPVPDDRNQLAPGDKCILIIDGDSGSTEPIKAHAYERGYRVLVAKQLQTGLHFADYYLPAAIFANLGLPGTNGWTMIRRIKANPRNRHIPVFTLSPHPDDFAAATHGAAGHVLEPITPRHLESAFRRIDHLQSMEDRSVLLLSPDPDCAARVSDAVGSQAIRIITAATAAKADAVLKADRVHTVIVHSATSAADQRSLLAGLRHDPMPVLLYSETPSNVIFQSEAIEYEQTVNLNIVETPDQLLWELLLRLHLPPERLDDDHRDRLRAMGNSQFGLKARKVLLVDDDMRTVFAVSNILEDQGAEVLTGKTGKESLDKLDGIPDIDLILMDVMISGVDGYQAIRDLRNREAYRTLPIIALTAKAMRGDRAKCIEAGANDYLAKPVNLDKLTSMLKIWLDPHLPDSEPIGSKGFHP